METPRDAGTKVCSNGPGDMAKMAAMTMYGKKLLHKNQNVNYLGTWYVALGKGGPNDDPRLTLAYLTSRLNLLPNAFKRDFF